MANMSYCRFENTLSALRDCQFTLAEMADIQEEVQPLSRTELVAARALVETCYDILESVLDGAGSSLDELLESSRHPSAIIENAVNLLQEGVIQAREHDLETED